jgi:hypothetical protein
MGQEFRERPRPYIVVAGLGNEYRRDDGAGPVTAARIVAQLPAEDIGPVVDPLELLGRWDDADLAIVIDAVRSCPQAMAATPRRARTGSASVVCGGWPRLSAGPPLGSSWWASRGLILGMDRGSVPLSRPPSPSPSDGRSL